MQRSASGDGWVLTHPRCARDRAEDLEEVRLMIEAGEGDVAVDELRWLVGGCSEMIEAHFLLGKLAVELDGDPSLARGHFGFGHQMGAKAFRRARCPGPLSAMHPANRSFYDCGRGLAWKLRELGKTPMAIEVVEALIAMDPADPLNLSAWLDELRTDGKTVVGIDDLLGR
ncbi:MAG: hypothetical protein AAGA92_08300 [Planctomycetota bacterium]